MNRPWVFLFPHRKCELVLNSLECESDNVSDIETRSQRNECALWFEQDRRIFLMSSLFKKGDKIFARAHCLLLVVEYLISDKDRILEYII